MRIFGLLCLFVAFALPASWFWPLADKHQPAAVLSQYFGYCALVAMSVSQMLSTRLIGLETVFGGMDQIYRLHKWLGISALSLILLHDTIDAEMDELGGKGALMDIADTLGEISLYGLLILAVISIATFIPYHLWKFTHKFMGVFFSMATLHFLLISKPFENADPVGLYVSAFCVVGLASYLYTLWPKERWWSGSRYKIADIRQTGDATFIQLDATGAGITHKPGQFAFIRFEVEGFAEKHPFTISSSPKENRSLSITVAQLGDLTRLFASSLKVGANAVVEGPFGHFQRAKRPGVEIWIAGGIGITPFLSWAEELKPTEAEIHLFYCVRDREYAAHLELIESLSHTKPNLHLHLVESAKSGRLLPETVSQATGENLSDTVVYFCGSKSMRSSLMTGLIGRGLRRQDFHFEEFVIRSGLGLERLANFLWERTMTHSK